ncbi:MAG TPA: aminoglycoside phosphotransferase family protein [Hanamia sp.]
MKKFENIKQIIKHEFPLFDISMIKKIGEGDNNNAFLINQNYIFRFPKRKEVKQNLKKEIAVLPRIRHQFKLELPKFDFVSKDINFVGYKIINGKFLTFKIYNSLPTEFQLQIQKSLSEFLSQLHSINLAMVKDCELETMNLKEEYSDNFENVQKLIFPNITRKNSELIEQLFAAYLNNHKNFEYKPTLIHNDFSTDHILIDISSKKITGIIDFGDIAIGDPDYDFMYLLDTFGANFIERMIRFYQQTNHKIVLEKLFLFSLANKLQIIVGSINDKDENAIKDGYNNLEKWIINYNNNNKDQNRFKN